MNHISVKLDTAWSCTSRTP